MLNYIWAGLIVSSFLFAHRLRCPRHQRATGTETEDRCPSSWPFRTATTRRPGSVPVAIRIEPAGTRASMESGQAPDSATPATCSRRKEGTQLRFAAGSQAPRAARQHRQGLAFARRGAAGTAGRVPTAGGPASVVFEPVRFVKLNAIASAAIDFAKTGGRDRARPGRRAGPLPRAAQDRRGLGGRLRAGEAGAADAPSAFSRSAPRPSGARDDRAQPHRQPLRPRQRGHAVRDQGDGGAAEAQPDARTPPPTRW